MWIDNEKFLNVFVIFVYFLGIFGNSSIISRFLYIQVDFRTFSERPLNASEDPRTFLMSKHLSHSKNILNHFFFRNEIIWNVNHFLSFLRLTYWRSPLFLIMFKIFWSLKFWDIFYYEIHSKNFDIGGKLLTILKNFMTILIYSCKSFDIFFIFSLKAFICSGRFSNIIRDLWFFLEFYRRFWWPSNESNSKHSRVNFSS